MEKVIIYTDGACSGNPGPGGWGTILMYKEYKKELSGGVKQTTNNIMEITAVLEGLKALKMQCEVEVYSDSAYVVNAFNSHWIDGWKKNGWKNSQKEEVKNKELWQELDLVLKKYKEKLYQCGSEMELLDSINLIFGEMEMEQSHDRLL